MRSFGNLHGVSERVRVLAEILLSVLTHSLLAIVGLQGFFPLKGEAAVGVGAVEYPVTERKRLAMLYVTISNAFHRRNSDAVQVSGLGLP